MSMCKSSPGWQVDALTYDTQSVLFHGEESFKRNKFMSKHDRIVAGLPNFTTRSMDFIQRRGVQG